MNLVFAHDHLFYHAHGKVYSPGKLPYSVFKRYLTHFDDITVISRFINTSEVSSHWSLASGENISFVKIKNKSSLRELIYKNKKEYNQIIKIIKNSDGVVVRLPSEIGLLVAKIAKKLGKKYIAEVVACPWDAMLGYGSAKSLLYAPLLTYRTKSAIENAWGAIYVTRQFLQGRYPNSNSVSISNVELKNEVINRLQKKIDISSINIGMIGSLDSPHKGFDTAYRAIHLLRKRGFNVTLQIVGGGSKYKNMQLISKLSVCDRIEHLGCLPPGKSVYKFLDTVDIYIQPSNQEGLPRSVIEAMSRGCPVVLSSAGGMPELVSPEFIHKPCDHIKLANIIQALIENEAIYQRCINMSLETANNFNHYKLSKKRFNFFEKYCNSL